MTISKISIFVTDAPHSGRVFDLVDWANHRFLLMHSPLSNVTSVLGRIFLTCGAIGIASPVMLKFENRISKSMWLFLTELAVATLWLG